MSTTPRSTAVMAAPLSGPAAPVPPLSGSPPDGSKDPAGAAAVVIVRVWLIARPTPTPKNAAATIAATVVATAAVRVRRRGSDDQGAPGTRPHGSFGGGDHAGGGGGGQPPPVDPDWLGQPAPEDPGADHGLAPTGGAGWPGGDHSGGD